MKQDDQGYDAEELVRERRRLSELPYFQRDPNHSVDGVLRSDLIEHYSQKKFALIQPFDPKSLRPAGYDLRVGDNYAIGGKRNPVALRTGGTITIGPYQVAIIQTLETLNIPEFLIGRWNIRVKLAYNGLLWVGGAQVDPGFRGRLCCPIYNLSSSSVKLKHGERLAMIDFVSTTPMKDGVTKPFQWWSDKSLIFEQYDTHLVSGVENELNRIKTESAAASSNVASITQRMDTFMTLTFTVVAVLFAGLGIIATKGSEDPSFLTSPVLISVVALYFALRPYVILYDRDRSEENRQAQSDKGEVQEGQTRKWYAPLLPRPLEVLICSLIVVASLVFHLWHAHVSGIEVRQAKNQASLAMQALDQERTSLEREIHYRQQSDARLESLQQQLNLLIQNQTRKK